MYLRLTTENIGKHRPCRARQRGYKGSAEAIA